MINVVFAGRNDWHGGKSFSEKVTEILDRNYWTFSSHDLEHIFWFIEWGQEPGRDWLSPMLADRYPTCRCIMVPDEIVQDAQTPPVRFQEFTAKNIGIARAHEGLVIATNSDIVFSKELTQYLKQLHPEENCIYRAPRHDFFCNGPLPQDEKDFRWTKIFDLGHKYCEASGDFTAMTVSTWHKIGGYCESPNHVRHLDSETVIKAINQGMRFVKTPPVYHKEHPDSTRFSQDWKPQWGVNDKGLSSGTTIMQRNSVWGHRDCTSEVLGENMRILRRYAWKSLGLYDAGTTQQDLAAKRHDKYLSIVVTARNDNHGGNMLHRMQVFTDGLFSQCQKYNIDAELIIVEWNPPPNKKRLSEVIEWPKFAAPLTVRIIEVSPEIHSCVGNSDKIPLFQMIAKNVGIQRASGKFVLSTCIDILFSDELMWFLARQQLDEDCFYRICRYDVGSKVIPTDDSIEKQLEYCRQNLILVQGLSGTEDIREKETKIGHTGIKRNFFELSENEIAASLKRESEGKNLFTNACGDFTMMARDKWFSLRGYPELPKWSIYLDGLLLHMAHVSGLHQIILPDPMRIYHIEHDMSWAVTQAPIHERPSLNYDKEYLPWCKKMLWEKRPLNPNDQNWGLALEDLKESILTDKGTQYLKGKTYPSNETATENQRELKAKFKSWIDELGNTQNRLYYRDQTPESLLYLYELAQSFRPTKIIELGTLSGLSLRTWISADIDARIYAVDLSFEALHQSRKILPVDLSMVDLVEQDILAVDFSNLWHDDDRVLLYIDAHDLPAVPIMEHVINTAVPKLPDGSLIVVDDLWYSAETLSADTVRQFFEGTVQKEIDALQCFEGYYAPFWQGGSFFGFREVVPLMEWVGRHKVDLMIPTNIKAVAFRTPHNNSGSPDFDYRKFAEYTGRIQYNPVEAICGNWRKSKFSSPELYDLGQKGARHYADGELSAAWECFQKITEEHPAVRGVWHIRGLILARLAKYTKAEKSLQKELQNHGANPPALQLLEDMRTMKRLMPALKSRPFKAKPSAKPITIITVPKPFEGHDDLIQRNAIRSWTLIEPRPEIIVLGNEKGIAEIANEYHLVHIPHVRQNQFGTPLLNSIVETARSASKNDVMMYINTDIILSGDVMPVVQIVKQQFDQFLIIGQRWDLNIVEPISSKELDSGLEVSKVLELKGSLHSPSGIDYFIFAKNPWGRIPPFALGRTAWDGWLVFKALSCNIPVIDATEKILAIHQNHDYHHAQGGYTGVWHGPEALLNQKLSGGYHSVRSVADASWCFIRGQLKPSRCDFPDLTKGQQSPADFAQRLFKQSIYFLKEHNFERALSCMEEAQRNNGSTDGFKKVLKLAQEGRRLSQLLECPK